MASVEINQIGKVYPNGYVAMQSADLTVEEGEFMVLVGPSGCGKSTLLRMIAGLEDISSGELRIGGKVCNRLAPKDRGIAMVFQNYALYPHMTVRENLGFGLKHQKTPKDVIAERVEEVADMLELSAILDRKPKQLSGGQRQRVAVGRAIARKADVYLFDEPLSNLDASLRVAMRTEISNLHRTLGKTMIYVTHDQTEAMTMGDRIVVLKKGEVQQVDTPLNLYHYPANAFVAGFIGSPSMNFIEGQVSGHDDNRLWFKAHGGPFALPLPDMWSDVFTSQIGRNVQLGIRPEHFYEPSSHRLDVFSNIKVDINLTEPMGNEVVVYASIGSDKLVIRDLFPDIPKKGTSVDLSCDLANLHFFDPDTGASLRPDRN